MIFNPDIHHRRSIRLNGYDYSEAGAYFVTIGTWNRECLFGSIANSNMELSSIGRIVEQEGHDIPKRFPDVELDAFVVMPNHIHGIILVGATLVVAHNDKSCSNTNKRAGTSPAPTLGQIVGSFKSLCIYRCKNIGLNAGKLWQRNYYEHIIRDEDEMNRFREYIVNNPLKWAMDENNPANTK